MIYTVHIFRIYCSEYMVGSKLNKVHSIYYVLHTHQFPPIPINTILNVTNGRNT